MGEAIILLDAEGDISVAEVGAGKVGDGVIGERWHPSILNEAIWSPKRGKRVVPDEYSRLPGTRTGRFATRSSVERTSTL